MIKDLNLKTARESLLLRSLPDPVVDTVLKALRHNSAGVEEARA